MKRIILCSILLTLFSYMMLASIEPISANNVQFAGMKNEVILPDYLSRIDKQATASFVRLSLFSLLGLGILGITFSFVNLGSRRIKQHNHYLEDQIKERTQTLEEKHRQLQSQNEAYKEALALIHEQKEAIESAQQDLLAKNKDLREAFEEIQSQNELLDYERSKLVEAKKIIQTQNTKLLSIARNLDQQVQKRTAELSVSNNLLLEKNKELDDFIYKSAHDLRGPIARFKGLSQLIQLEYQQGNDIDSHLIHLHESANHMDHMLRRLSNVYEISARPISLQKMKIELVLETVFERLKQEENYDYVEIHIENTVNDHFLLDPSLLHLILKNLIGNAIRFQDPLKLNKWVKVKIEFKDEKLHIQVIDNGIGIKQPQQQNLFDLFYVGSEFPKGPGLGLYICKLITKKLNGHIELKYSYAERETAFEVHIPIKLLTV